MREDIREGMRRLWSSDLQNIVCGIRNKTFKYEEKDPEPINWRMYDKAQINELADMLDIIKYSVDVAVERITPKTNTTVSFPGRPEVVPEGSIAKMMLLQTYFGTSNRIGEGLLKVFDRKLGIFDRFGYKTLERGYDPESVGRILDEVFVLTNEWANSNEDTFGIDGSGDPTTMKVNYESKRANQRRKKAVKASQEVITAWPITTEKRKDFQYSVLSCGRHTKVIAGFSTSENHHVSELSRFNDVVNETRKNAPRFKVLLGDTLYANRKVCKITASCNIALYSIPRSNSTMKSKGVKEWSRMTYELVLDPQGFLSVYHGRSISETVNSMMKRREPMKLRKRLSGRRATEEQLKVIIHNLRQCCYLTYLAPEFLNISGAG
jgi:transposase